MTSPDKLHFEPSLSEPEIGLALLLTGELDIVENEFVTTEHLNLTKLVNMLLDTGIFDFSDKLITAYKQSKANLPPSPDRPTMDRRFGFRIHALEIARDASELIIRSDPASPMLNQKMPDPV